MSISLECKKVKRTGFLPAFFVGSILAAAVPVINMAVRSEMYLNQPDSPIQILLGANWQMMTMLNVLLVIAAAKIPPPKNASKKPVRFTFLHSNKTLIAPHLVVCYQRQLRQEKYPPNYP